MKDIHVEHEKWVREVRDPATRNSEGVREIEVKNAKIEYEVAQINERLWGVTWRFCYHSGDIHGHLIPWISKNTREECIEAFVNAANDFFAKESTGMSDCQKVARRDMLSKLEIGLFGFEEPEVSEEATQRRKEIM